VAKPILLVLDDEAEVLNAVERDLRRQYGEAYRIVKAGSGDEALAALGEFRKRGSAVALFLVDQRMPGMSGTQFLTRAAEIFPEARKVLLTAYADTQAAIEAINDTGLDHYLMKPWDPPEHNLYPILDSLLAEWKVTARIPFEGIRLVGALWSAGSHTAKSFLARNQIPYQWLDVDRDQNARKMVEEANGGELRLPTLFFPDGSQLVEPTMLELAERAGLHTEAESHFYDLVIMGAGPAGLAAAVYAASEGLSCVLIEKDAPGGQAGLSAKIDNYLGFPSGISGADLTRRATTQARRFGAEILSPVEVSGIRLSDPFRFVQLTSGVELACHAVIVATGAGYRQVEVPGAARLTGKGVYYGAATTEAHYFRDQPMFVIGGANSAGQGAMFLSRYASRVYMVVRQLQMKASDYLKRALIANDKIEIMYQTDLVELRGDDCLTEVVTQNIKSGEQRVTASPALFIFIGVAPRTTFLTDLVQLDERGFVLTGPDLMQGGKRPSGWTPDRDPFLMESSVPGIFVAGDARHGTKNRVAGATGDGGIAVSMVHEYLKTV
jgi:thioredoxin reductase (NADPH)